MGPGCEHDHQQLQVMGDDSNNRLEWWRQDKECKEEDTKTHEHHEGEKVEDEDEHCELISSSETLGAERARFVINFTLTLALVALLLALAFVRLEAQELAQTLDKKEAARRLLVAQDEHLSHSSEPASHQGPWPVAATQDQQHPQLDPEHEHSQEHDEGHPRQPTSPAVAAASKVEQAAVAHSGTAVSKASPPSPSTRQIRATTRRRLTSPSSSSTTSTSTTTTSTPSSGGASSTTASAAATTPETDSTTPTTSRPPVLSPLETSSSGASEQAELDNSAEQQAELERARKRRLKHRRRKQQDPMVSRSTTSTTSTTEAPSAVVVRPQKQPSSDKTTNTTSGNSARLSTRPTPKTTTRAKSTTTPATATVADYSRSPAVNETSAGEYYDPVEEDEDYEEQMLDRLATTQKAANSASSTTRRPRVETSSSSTSSRDRHSGEHPDGVSSGGHHADKSGHLLHAGHRPHATAANATTGEHHAASNGTDSLAIDGRSPSSLSKRLSDMISEQKNKLLRPTTQPPLSAAAARQSTAKRPLEPTTTSTSTSTTTGPPPTQSQQQISPSGSMIVQVANQTEPKVSGANVSTALQIGNLTGNLDHHLDWSKLVKVHFKSAHDNHTIYTLVMNSSELAQHPIRDWSNELPGLLQRDFEKLTQKWSNVFPIVMDNLMSNLTKIIKQTTTTKMPHDISVPASVAFARNTSSPLGNLPVVVNGTSGGQQPFAPSTNTNTTATATATTNPPLTTTTRASFLAGGTNSSTTGANFTSRPLAGVDMAGAKSANGTLVVSLPSKSNETSLTNVTATTAEHITRNFTSIAASDLAAIKLGNQTSAANETAVNSSENNNITSTTTTTSASASASTSTARRASLDAPDKSRGIGGSHAHQSVGGGRAAEQQNKTIHEIIRDIRDENIKIEDNVKEQGSSLRHFIIICSVAVVVATSLVVALIVLLFK